MVAHFSACGVGNKLHHHSQLLSMKNFFNEKVAKKPKSSQKAK